MDGKQKILVCGDVEGKFNALFNRVTAINNKSGPFNCLICVGNFFGINNKEFDAYKIGDKKVPIQTYILGPNSEDHVELYPKDDNIDICHNVQYLGKRGVFTDAKGLKIAYISGLAAKDSNEYEYNSKDITELYNACVRGNPSFRGVDILLTSQWPEGIQPKDGQKAVKSSPLPSWLALKLKPRYHISAMEGFYFECPPFRCPNLGDHDTTINLATRFIGLARVANVKKDKWIYALSLTSLDKMKISELLQKTTDETDCPLVFADLEQKIFNTKRKAAGSGQYFYDMSAPLETGKRNNKPKRQRVEFDQSKCWFCLASPSVEKHLIVAVGDVTYLAVAKGGLVESHFLICPIEHHQSSLTQPEEVTEELNKFKEAVRKFYKENQKEAVFFERNYKTSHMQIQAVPIPKIPSKELADLFMAEAESQGLKLEILPDHGQLHQVVQKNAPFFTVQLPDNTVLYTRIKGNFPLNFAREVLALDSILNLPERVDWKDCILQKEEEIALLEKLRKDFEPFDFTQ